jgi:NAD(P)-dependent dehydrogenase (short-subunit alcohol dehydrogenase family)
VSFDLTGRIAVVTGAHGLLGQQHCAALAAAGATVIAVDRTESLAQAVASALGEHHRGVGCDITSESDVRTLREWIVNVYGHFDILVNNAAINDMVEGRHGDVDATRFEHYPTELFRSVLDVNVTGMMLCCRELGSLLAERGSGSIINIASTYGVVAPDQRLYVDREGRQTMFKSIAYPVSKGAVVMMTRFLASYWGGHGVRVNTLSPGGVLNGQPDDFVEAYALRTPLGRMAAPSDYHGALVFLASEASAYVTGHNLIVDGGWTTW